MAHSYLCGQDRTYTAIVGVHRHSTVLFGIVVNGENGEVIDELRAQTVEAFAAALEPRFSLPRHIETALRAEFAQRSAARKAKTTPIARKYRNAGRPWQPTEDEDLVSRFNAGASIEDLALAFGRTEGGVKARLVKHGTLSYEDAYGAKRIASAQTPRCAFFDSPMANVGVLACGEPEDSWRHHHDPICGEGKHTPHYGCHAFQPSVAASTELSLAGNAS